MRTKADLIATIRADQQFWRDLAAEVSPGRYAEPGPMGEWNFGDMAGHLLGWRSRTLARLEARRSGLPEPPDPWPAGLDDDDEAGTDGINAWIAAQHVGRTPEELVGEYDASYDRLVAAIDSMPHEILTDPDAIPWIGGPLVDADFTDHLHDEHVPGVRAWLDGSGRSAG